MWYTYRCIFAIGILTKKKGEKYGLFDCIDAFPRRPRRALRPPVLQELVGGRDIKNWEYPHFSPYSFHVIPHPFELHGHSEEVELP